MELVVECDTTKNITNVTGPLLYISPGWQDSESMYCETDREEAGYSEMSREAGIYSES